MAQWEIVDDNNGTWEMVDSSTSSEPEDVGWQSIAKDVGGGAIKAVPEAFKMLWNLPGHAYESGKQAYQDPERAMQNIRAGSASGLGGLLNVPGNIVDYLQEKEVAPPWLKAWKPGENGLLPADFNYRGAEGLNDVQPGDELLYGLSQFAPSSLLGGAAPAAWAVGQNENPVTAQLMPQVLKGTGRLASELTPSALTARFGGSTRGMPEILENARAAEGTNTPLGDVIGSPAIKMGFENVSANVPGSRGTRILGDINQQVEQRANRVFDDLAANHPRAADSNFTVKRILDTAFDTARTEKNALYNDASRLARENNVQFDMPDFVNGLMENAAAIRSSPLYTTNARFRKAFNDNLSLLEYDASPSLSQLKLLVNDLDLNGRRLQKLPAGTDKFTGEMYSDLANTGRREITNSINRSGVPELINTYTNAERNYANNYAQFLDKDIHSFFANDKDAHTIVREIIAPSKKNDSAATIERIQNIMPQGNENLLGYTYLRGALDKNGDLQVNELNSLVKALGPRQFNTLFPEATTRQSLLDFGNLARMNAEARNLLNNPKTGYRGTKIGIAASMASAAFAFLVAGDPVKAAAAIGVPIAAARYFNNRATNPGFRQAVLNRMLRNNNGNPAGPTPLSDIAGNLGLATLAGENTIKDEENK